MGDTWKLGFLLIGNLCKWIIYGGKKSMKEVVNEDNELLGILISAFIFILFFLYYF